MLLTPVLVAVAIGIAQAPRDPLSVSADRVQDGTTLVAEEVFSAMIASVEDGDSVIIKDSGRLVELRLGGVDAPELAQAFGSESKMFLSRLVTGQRVTVRLKTGASDGRVPLARLEVNGLDVSVELVRNGLAWPCRGQARDRALLVAEEEARGAKRGIWSEAEPTPPWQHRGTAGCWQEKKQS